MPKSYDLFSFIPNVGKHWYYLTYQFLQHAFSIWVVHLQKDVSNIDFLTEIDLFTKLWVIFRLFLLAGSISNLVANTVLDSLIGLKPDLRVSPDSWPQSPWLGSHWRPIPLATKWHCIISHSTDIHLRSPLGNTNRAPTTNILVQLVKIVTWLRPVQLVFSEPFLPDIPCGSSMSRSKERANLSLTRNSHSLLSKHLLSCKLLDFLYIPEE